MQKILDQPRLIATVTLIASAGRSDRIISEKGQRKIEAGTLGDAHPFPEIDDQVTIGIPQPEIGFLRSVTRGFAAIMFGSKDSKLAGNRSGDVGQALLKRYRPRAQICRQLQHRPSLRPWLGTDPGASVPPPGVRTRR